MYFHFFVFISHWNKAGPLHLNKLESPSPKDALCQVWLKLAQWFWRRTWKCEKLTDRQRDEGRQVTSSGELKTHFNDFFLLIYSFCKIFSRAATLLASNWSFSLSKAILSLCIALNSALYSTTHAGSACTLLLLGGFNDGRSEDFSVSLFFSVGMDPATLMGLTAGSPQSRSSIWLK